MSTVNIFQNQRALMVKNLRPGLTECGKIKIGQKGALIKSRQGNEFQPPQKLDHFVITTLERGSDGNFVHDAAMHSRFGKAPREVPVRLLFNDPWLNFQTTYAAFKGGTRFCTGDGERAERIGPNGAVTAMDCPCHLLDPTYDGKDKCKINGTLSVVIDGAEIVGGVWKLRTTSINTCQGIASSLALLSSVTGGQIAGVPLMLTIRPKASVTPQGASTTVYVVGLEFRGSLDSLRDLAHQRALTDATFGQRMQRIEEQARALLTAPVVDEDEATDLVEEFYPDAAAEMHDAPISTPRSAAPPDDLLLLVDPDGEEFSLSPGEAEQRVTDWCREATDEALATLVENNPDTPIVADAVTAERARRADPLRLAGLGAKAFLATLESGLNQAVTAADADRAWSIYEDKARRAAAKLDDATIADELAAIVVKRIAAEAAEGAAA